MNKIILISIVISICISPILGNYIKFEKNKKIEIELKSYANSTIVKTKENKKNDLPVDPDSEAKRKTINRINQFLKGKMENKGAVIYESCKKQNPQVNAKMFTSIIILESGKNFNSYNVIHNNNVSGMNWTRDSRYEKNGWYVKYSSVDESIEDLAHRLSRYYIAQGLTTIDEIGAKYAPIDDPREGLYGMSNKNWARNVTEIYNQISSEV